MSGSADFTPNELGRLRWQCRRGMKELDVLLTRYLERHFAAASSADRKLFGDLLRWQDPDLARYLLAGEIHSHQGLAALIERIRTP